MSKIDKKITLISIMADDLEQNVNKYIKVCKTRGHKWVLNPWEDLKPGEKYDQIKADIRRLRRELLVLSQELEKGVSYE